MTDQLDAVADRQASQPPPEAEIDPSVGEYRYPGAPPFADSEMDRLLFRGRASEIDQVLHSILSFDLFLIYAISGLGKTSLLSAGVMKPLRQRDYFPVLIRLNNPDRSPVDLIDEQLREAASKVEGITVMRNPSVRDIEGPPSTLWDLLSRLEVWKGNTLQHPVLVFDQFEELFTLGWNNDQRAQFIEQFGQVIRRHRAAPADLRADPATLLPPPAVKIVLIIREDFLGELEAMAQQVPQIMRHRFRLDGLVPAQAELAIREPARISDQRLATPQFAYSEGAAQAILAFLGARQDRGRPALTQTIDPSQLQIICQHVERSILPTKSASDGTVVEISEDDLGGRTGLDRILSDFYRREIASFPPSQRKIVRNLCETGLINQRGRRLSLEEEEIGAKYKVSKSTLEDLVARRLLRAEPRVGSVYYELAHDTLAAPILAYRDGARRARRRHWLEALAAVAVIAALGLLFWRMSTKSESAAVPGGEKISVGDTVTGIVSGSKSYVFDATDNQTLIVDVRPTAEDGFDTLMLAVTEPEREVADANGVVQLDADTAVLNRTVKGRYLVVVSGFESSAAIGFDLSVRSADVIQTAIGASKPGTVDSDHPAVVFELDPPDAQSLIVEATPDEGNSLDAVVQVSGTNGFVGWADDTGANGLVDDLGNTAGSGSEALLVDSTVKGRYRIVVSGFGSSTGQFQLSVRPANVVEMAIDDTKSGAIDVGNSLAVFTFDAPEDPSVIVELESKAGTSLDTVLLNVTDPNGLLGAPAIITDENVETALVDTTAKGRYVIVVRGSGSSAVEFELSVRAAEAVPVAIGESTSGDLGPTNPFALFTFDAPAEQAVVIEVKPEAGNSLDLAALRVTDPNGLTYDAYPAVDKDQAETVVVANTVIGRYRIVLSALASTTVAFDVSVHPVTVEEMVVGRGVSGRIDADHPAAVFEFTPPNAQTFIVELKPEDSLDGILQVTNPDVPIDDREDFPGGGGIETAIVDGTAPGSYLVVVSGFESTTGGFDMSAHLAEVEQMAIGDTRPGTIDGSNPVAVFEFKAPDTEPVAIEVTPANSFLPVLEVIDPMAYMYTSYGADKGQEAVQVEGVRGRYLVVIKGYGAVASTGDFKVSVHRPDG